MRKVRSLLTSMLLTHQIQVCIILTMLNCRTSHRSAGGHSRTSIETASLKTKVTDDGNQSTTHDSAESTD